MNLSHMTSLPGMVTVLDKPRQQLVVLFFLQVMKSSDNVFSSQILEDAEHSSLCMAVLSCQ